MTPFVSMSNNARLAPRSRQSEIIRTPQDRARPSLRSASLISTLRSPSPGDSPTRRIIENQASRASSRFALLDHPQRLRKFLSARPAAALRRALNRRPGHCWITSTRQRRFPRTGLRCGNLSTATAVRGADFSAASSSSVADDSSSSSSTSICSKSRAEPEGRARPSLHPRGRPVKMTLGEMRGQSYAYVFILHHTAQGGPRRSDTMREPACVTCSPPVRGTPMTATR